MSPEHVLLLIAAGAFAGTVNAVVGGATFFTFPILLAIGLPPVTANATNTVSLVPASIAAAFAYKTEIKTVRAGLPWRLAVAVAGGIIGALLLLASGDALFFSLVPWLLAGATLLFAFSAPILRLLTHNQAKPHSAVGLLLEFLFAIYGGYFGAGLGILLMAGLALAGYHDVHLANAQKNLLAAVINSVAVVLFAAQGVVVWSVALVMAAGAIAGGFLGARLARRVPKTVLRVLVIGAGAILSAVYFVRVYG
jgi:uncharacterized membrane protein YfcA